MIPTAEEARFWMKSFEKTPKARLREEAEDIGSGGFVMAVVEKNRLRLLHRNRPRKSIRDVPKRPRFMVIEIRVEGEAKVGGQTTSLSR